MSTTTPNDLARLHILKLQQAGCVVPLELREQIEEAVEIIVSHHQSQHPNGWDSTIENLEILAHQLNEGRKA